MKGFRSANVSVVSNELDRVLSYVEHLESQLPLLRGYVARSLFAVMAVH